MRRRVYDDRLQELLRKERQLKAILPLFEEARDALTAITESSRLLHGVRKDLAERMDWAGWGDNFKEDK